MSESHWWNLFRKEVKSWYSTTWYLQMHLLANNVRVFWEGGEGGGWWSEFSLRGNQDLSNGPNVASYYLANFSFCLHIYNLWVLHAHLENRRLSKQNRKENSRKTDGRWGGWAVWATRLENSFICLASSEVIHESFERSWAGRYSTVRTGSTCTAIIHYKIPTLFNQMLWIARVNKVLRVWRNLVYC